MIVIEFLMTGAGGDFHLDFIVSDFKKSANCDFAILLHLQKNIHYISKLSR